MLDQISAEERRGNQCPDGGDQSDDIWQVEDIIEGDIAGAGFFINIVVNVFHKVNNDEHQNKRRHADEEKAPKLGGYVSVQNFHNGVAPPQKFLRFAIKLEAGGWTMKKLCLLMAGVLWAQNHPTDFVIERIQSRWDGTYPIKFAVLGDNYNINRIFTAIMSQIHSIEDSLDFVLITGDLTAGGDSAGYADYLAMIDTFDVPIISVMGNHELNAEGGWDRYIEYFGSPDFYFDIGAARFVCLTDCYPADSAVSGSENVYYKFLPEQLDWLEDVLSGGDGYKFVSIHSPPYLEGHYTIYTVGGIGSAPDYEESLTERFTDILRDYNVYACFMGHFHTYDRWTPHNERYGDATYIISGGGGASIVPMWPYGPPYGGGIFHFMIMELYEDGTMVGHIVRPDTIDDSIVEVNYDSLYEFTLEAPTKVVENRQNTPDNVFINAFPNPFNSVVRIEVSPPSARVIMTDISGHIVDVLGSSDGCVEWRPDGVSSGIYIVNVMDRTTKIVYLR